MIINHYRGVMFVPKVVFVAMAGIRVGNERIRQLGMTLPALTNRASVIERLPSLGLLTLAGMTPPDWTCSLIEAMPDDDDLAERVLSEHPSLVAISSLTASAIRAYELAGRMRSAHFPTVFGGLHATSCPDESSAYFDSVVIGDGEPVWPTVLADAQFGTLRRRYQSPSPFSLADPPTPRFDLASTLRPARFTLQTQRGCPWACDFCGASRLLGPHRTKPVSSIAKELGAIGAITKRLRIELADDNTFAGRGDSGSLLEVLGESGIRYFTESDWRIGERPRLLERLAASGCEQVLIGIESLVFRHPGMGAKEASLDRIMDAVNAVQGSGVVVNGCIIVGADGESFESLDRLEAFLLECPLGEIQLTLETPFPGTPLRSRLAKEGRLIKERGWPYYTLFDVTHQPTLLSVAELESGFERLISSVFCQSAEHRRKGIRRRIWREFRQRRMQRCK